MGFIFGLLFTCLAAWGFYSLVTKPAVCRSIWAKFKARPFYGAFVYLWCISLLGFFWGALFHVAFLVHTPFGRLEFWQASGLVALIGFVCFWFFPKPFG